MALLSCELNQIWCVFAAAAACLHIHVLGCTDCCWLLLHRPQHEPSSGEDRRGDRASRVCVRVSHCRTNTKNMHAVAYAGTHGVCAAQKQSSVAVLVFISLRSVASMCVCTYRTVHRSATWGAVLVCHAVTCCVLTVCCLLALRQCRGGTTTSTRAWQSRHWFTGWRHLLEHSWAGCCTGGQGAHSSSSNSGCSRSSSSSGSSSSYVLVASPLPAGGSTAVAAVVGAAAVRCW